MAASRPFLVVVAALAGAGILSIAPPPVAPVLMAQAPEAPPATPTPPATEPQRPAPTPGSTEDLVEITGPEKAATGSYFILSVKTPKVGDDVLVEFHAAVPLACPPPIELLSKNPGESLYLYQQVPAGLYRFTASAQVSVDKAEGFDPHDDDEWTVTVGGAVPVTPDQPPPDDPETPTVPTDKATAATYVYEKDQGAVPSPVLSALNKLNRDRHIIATVLEADTKDGTGDVPDQYKVPLEAAKKAGLPALVVTAGDKVISVLPAPKDEQAVLDAVK